jgi:NAD(P)-dependent dehydrogenase (short-subunit alcohol dehydrogenase family)
VDLELAGRTAFVTGGSRGIGMAAARALAQEGASVAICARTREPLEHAARTLSTETGATVMPFVADTTVGGSVTAAVAAAADALGGIQIVVNAAARPSGGIPEDLEHVTEETILADVREKVLGYLSVAREAIPWMRAAGWGRIVNVSGLTGRTAGSVSAGIRNAAVVHLTKTMSVELGRDGITVNAVYPALTLTERVEERLRARAETEGTSFDEVLASAASSSAIGRLVTPAEVASVVAFLCSPRSVAITGEAVAVGGGIGSAVYY